MTGFGVWKGRRKEDSEKGGKRRGVKKKNFYSGFTFQITEQQQHLKLTPQQRHGNSN